MNNEDLPQCKGPTPVTYLQNKASEEIANVLFELRGARESDDYHLCRAVRVLEAVRHVSEVATDLVIHQKAEFDGACQRLADAMQFIIDQGLLGEFKAWMESQQAP